MFSLFEKKESRADRLEKAVLILARKIYGVKKSADKSDSIAEYLDGEIDIDGLNERLNAKYTDKE